MTDATLDPLTLSCPQRKSPAALAVARLAEALERWDFAERVRIRWRDRASTNAGAWEQLARFYVARDDPERVTWLSPHVIPSPHGPLSRPPATNRHSTASVSVPAAVPSSLRSM